MKSPFTTLCYIEKEDCYLMLHRIKKENDINKDKWIGIGGHFEDQKFFLIKMCYLKHKNKKNVIK